MLVKPLTLDGIPMRSHNIIGIYELNSTIIFLHSVLGDIPKDQTTKNTIFPEYIIGDFFSADFGIHSQNKLVYRDKEIFYHTNCVCEPKNNYLLLNTLYYKPVGSSFSDNGFVPLARMIKIKDNLLHETGTSPEPVSKIFPGQKIYIFLDYSIRMVSEFIMECTSCTTGLVIWRLRLNAWLYTEITEKNNILYFGTAGHGGKIYGISLYDGQILFAYDTGGTTNYEWYNENILVTDRKGSIVFLDSKTGTEVRRITVKNQKQKLHILQMMLLRNNSLYTIAQRNKAPYHDFYAICVNL